MSQMNPLDDYIDECMDDTGVQATFEQFMEAFCKRCLNSNCKRSRLNDMKWKQRMARQAEAAFNPTFGDPSDPQLESHANQSFETFEDQQVRVSEWESFESADTPSRMEERHVHRADAPTQKHDGRKIKDAVNQLAGINGKETKPAPEPETQKDQEPVSEPASPNNQKQPVVQEKEEVAQAPAQAPEERPKKKVAKKGRTQYNTEAPSDGMVLKPREEIMKPSQSSDSTKNDPWAVKEDTSDKRLIVRASDGKVLDEDDVKRKGDDDDEESS